MTRVVTVGGRPFLLAVTGLRSCSSCFSDQRHCSDGCSGVGRSGLRTVEAALSTGAEDLPVLPLTGQRDLDRIVGAINGAGAKASEARRRTESLLLRVAEGERLAQAGPGRCRRRSRNTEPDRRHAVKGRECSPPMRADRSRTTDALRVVVEQVGANGSAFANLLRSVQRSDIKRRPVADIRKFLADHATLFREQAGRRAISVEVRRGFEPQVSFDTAQIGWRARQFDP